LDVMHITKAGDVTDITKWAFHFARWSVSGWPTARFMMVAGGAIAGARDVDR
jgi:hypothetical protein